MGGGRLPGIGKYRGDYIDLRTLRAAPERPPAGFTRLFVKGADGDAYQLEADGTETALPGGGGGPTYSAWTPVLTATTTNPTLGTGSAVSGRHFQNGKHVVAYGAINFGTSGVAAGTGSYFISLPVTARTAVSNDMNVLGHGQIYDDSATAMRICIFTIQNTTTAQFRIVDGSTPVTDGSPWVWAASDVIMFHFDYEAA